MAALWRRGKNNSAGPETASTEKEILITQLREMLEDTTRRSLMERDKDESDMLQEKLQKVPLPIYIG